MRNEQLSEVTLLWMQCEWSSWPRMAWRTGSTGSQCTGMLLVVLACQAHGVSQCICSCALMAWCETDAVVKHAALTFVAWERTVSGLPWSDQV
jgi:hypothetical protein